MFIMGLHHTMKIKWFGFFALRCICTLYLKFVFYIFENVKKIKEKHFVYISMFYVSTKSLQEINKFLHGLCKMTKFGTKISFNAMYTFFFFAQVMKISFFHETLCE
jgi:hypothetical protein